MVVREDTCGAEDFHHVLLREVRTDLLVCADDDVISGGVPTVAQGVDGVGGDESRDHALTIAGMEETINGTLGGGRYNGADGLAHGACDWERTQVCT